MYADLVRVVIRQTDSPFGGEVQDAISFEAIPGDEDIDAEAVTEDVRNWVMQQGYGRITFEERRQYTDAGASGVGVEFVLELLGAGATGVALQEIVTFIKSRVGQGEKGRLRDYFKTATNDELRDALMWEAERTFDVPRGGLEVEDFRRDESSVRLVATSRPAGLRYAITKDADGMLDAQRL